MIEGLPAKQDAMGPQHFFDLVPVPNIIMARDPQIVLGNGVIISAMHREAREREAILSQFVYTTHPLLCENPLHFDYNADERSTLKPSFGNLTLEGGDVLIFKEGVVVVGVSERTMEPSIDLLADTLRQLDQFCKLIMVRMPGSRSQMHLDTILTRVSEEECLVYPPMLQEGYAETLSVCSIELTSRKKDYGVRHPSLFYALGEAGIDVKPICCGGSESYIMQTREQWTDGANSFALAPGLIVLYGRNQATLEELATHGFDVVESSRFVQEAASIKKAVADGKKYVIAIESSELSRARGGPRCMTMPLSRSQL